MNIRLLPIAVVTVLFAASCANNDVEGPGVDVVTPADGAVVHVGNNIAVSVDFTDNEALNQYKIQVAGLQDTHSTFTFPEFDTIIVGSMSNGMFSSHNINIPVPNNVLPGPYKLSVFGLDQSGNETRVDKTIHLVDFTDTIGPVITLNTPANNATLNGNFNVDAVITDKLSDNINDGDIDVIEVNLVNANDASEQYQLGVFLAPNFNNAYDPQTEQFLKNIGIPGSVPSGNYHLLIVARDAYYNAGEVQINVSVP